MNKDKKVFLFSGREEDFPLKRFEKNNLEFSSWLEEDEVLRYFVEFLCSQEPVCLDEMLERIEKRIIMTYLIKANGNQREASRVLGMKYRTLNEKVKKHKIQFQKRPIACSKN